MTNGARQAPLNSRASSAAARDLPTQPARLSLTPAHARDHTARKQQGQATRIDAGGYDMDGGRASESSSWRQDQRAPRDKLGCVSSSAELEHTSLTTCITEITLTILSGTTRNLHLASAIILDRHRLGPLPRNAISYQLSHISSSPTFSRSSSRLVLASSQR